VKETNPALPSSFRSDNLFYYQCALLPMNWRERAAMETHEVDGSRIEVSPDSPMAMDEKTNSFETVGREEGQAVQEVEARSSDTKESERDY